MKLSDDKRGQTDALSSADQGTVEPVRVECIQGPGKGATAMLAGGLLFVGSASENELCIEDAAVSRRHASIELRPGGVVVRDLESRNGTWYLGARIREGHIPTGGTVRVGKTTLRIAPLGEQEAVSDREELCGLVARSHAMRRVFAQLEKVGPHDTTLLIRGETGVGKQLVARAAHALSPRANKPFETIDCAAISPSLAESELFGHVKGSFTGATADRPGLIAAAEGGTLFLESISELDLHLQPKLLRVLESREYRPVGGQQTLRANIRIIASGHQLEEAIAAGRLREDLYYRIAVTVIDIPPLRERLEDIAALAQHFAKQKAGVDVVLSPATITALQCDLWPGNVRELKNAVERVLTLGRHDVDTYDAQDEDVTYRTARERLLTRFERDYWTTLLNECGGNVSEAARRAGVSRVHLYRILKRIQVER